MIKEWKELSREEVFKKYSRKIEKVVFRLPEGNEADFYIKAEASAAAILAITKDNQILMVKQFRPGPKKILYELPGGYVEEGESGISAVERELLEETGYKAKVQYIGECLDDAYSTMRRFCYVATDCVKVTEPKQTKTEQVELKLLTLKEFRELLRSGQMTDVEVGYLALDFLKLL